MTVVLGRIRAGQLRAVLEAGQFGAGLDIYVHQ